MPAPIIEATDRRTNFSDMGTLGFLFAKGAQALQDNVTASLNRSLNVALSSNTFNAFFDATDRELSPEEALKEFGVKLISSRTEQQVIQLRDHQASIRYRDERIKNSVNGFFRQALGFGGTIVGSIVDPLNLATMGIGLEVGLAKGLAAGIASRLGGGRAARIVGDATTGAIDSAIGVAALEPVFATSEIYLQDEYGWENAAAALGFGAIFGASIRGGMKAFRELRAGNVISDVDVEDAAFVMMGQKFDGAPMNAGVHTFGKDRLIDVVSEDRQLASLTLEADTVRDPDLLGANLKEAQAQQKADIEEIRQSEAARQKARNEGVPDPEEPREPLTNDQGDEVNFREKEEQIAKMEQDAPDDRFKTKDIQEASDRINRIKSLEKNKQAFLDCLINNS